MKISLCIIFMLSVGNVLAQKSRLELHQEAQKHLEELTFYRDGKGMVVSPNIIKLYQVMKTFDVGTDDNGAINKRWGFNLVDGEIKGIFTRDYKRLKLGVLGCIGCHGGKAAGMWIPGLGNKTIDVGQVGADAYKAQFIWGSLPRRNPYFRPIHKQAMNFTRVLKHDQINNLSQGLVPTSLIVTWFYDAVGEAWPKDLTRGQVKVPPLFGHPEKANVGGFWDGLAKGESAGWAMAVELRGGNTIENVRAQVDKVHEAVESWADLLPPKYPFEIDHDLASRGKGLFSNTCQRCHGSYQFDNEGYPVYELAKKVPYRMHKTDQDRLNIVTPDLKRVIDKNPISDLMVYADDSNSGYIAPRLWGVWARFPYLHNASVPTLMDLLSAPSKRPKVFDLYRAGEADRFDKVLGGLLVERDTSSPAYLELQNKAQKGVRSIYSSKRLGHSSNGHWWKFSEEFTNEDKKAIIEYLKTL